MANKIGKSLKNNKRGSLLDILFMALIATIFSIVVLIGLHIANSINDEINQRTDLFDADAIHNTNLVVTRSENALNSGFLVLTIMTGLVALVLAALVRVHPIFIPFFFIAWVVVIFMSGIFSNIYQEISDQTVLAETTAKLTFVDPIMTMIPLIVGVFGILLMIVMYKLWSIDQ